MGGGEHFSANTVSEVDGGGAPYPKIVEKNHEYSFFFCYKTIVFMPRRTRATIEVRTTFFLRFILNFGA